ncbi:hypothetical protein [Holdemania filiformis]|uniref:hypothetical protein n=1 Tax=Holdemania filiformis TaxID=61171 RepID=UPI002670A943|nr:hypothetical protein [Holdemania filiformis]
MNGERGRSVSTGVIAVILIAIVALSIFFQNLDIFFPQLLEPDPQIPPPVVLELPSFLDGCLRNEENTLTIYEEDGIVHGDQFYQCEINELSEADEILKKQGLASINSQEIHFSMSIQIIRDPIRRQQALTKEMMDWQRLLQFVGCFYHCIRLTEIEITEDNILDYAVPLDAEAWQVDQIYQIDQEVFGTVANRLFLFNVADVLIPHESSDEIVLLDVTDPDIINKIRPLIDIEIPQP